jgi:hypothetical protein
VRWGALGKVSRECGRGCVGCTGKFGGHTLLWFNSKLMSKICVCVKLIAMLVYKIEDYSVMLVTS